MKAYEVYDSYYEEKGKTVVFAENKKEAKKIARFTEVCEDSDYICIRVRRFPEMDKNYRGKQEIDWYNIKDREALVKLGWTCLETSWECDECSVKNICSQWECEY